MSTPDPLTLISIGLQRLTLDTTADRNVYECGCEYRVRRERWTLCTYHEGFEDGVEMAVGPTSTPAGEGPAYMKAHGAVPDSGTPAEVIIRRIRGGA